MSSSRSKHAQWILTEDACSVVSLGQLGRVVAGSLMGVSELGGDERNRLIRSGLISSQMMGFALMRYVWQIEPIASMTDDEAIAALTPNLQRYVSGDLTAT